jgi:hypothetical protein
LNATGVDLAVFIGAISKTCWHLYTAVATLYVTIRLISTGASRWLADVIGLVW